MKVRYIAQHRHEPGQTDLVELDASSGIPGENHWVWLHEDWAAFPISMVTLQPGVAWIVKIVLGRDEAERMRDDIAGASK